MLTIVIPSYNEKNNLEPLFNQIDQALVGVTDYEVIVIDDSTDDTPQELERLSNLHPEFIYQHRTDERGLASAVVRGFSLARGDVLAVMDADLQHPPGLLATMYEAIRNGADIVLPSRYIAGGQDEGLNFYRKFASASAKYAGKLLLKSLHKISDPTSGYFMLRKKVIEGKSLNPIGWKILMEVLVLGDYSRVVEVPYAFQKRNADESKMSFKVTSQYFIHIFSLILRSEQERKFYLFLLVGFSGVFVDMLVYQLCSSLGVMHINISATISAFTAMLFNYFLSRRYVWASSKSSQRAGTALEFSKYTGVSALGIGVKNIFVHLLFSRGISDFIANFAGIIVASLFKYFLIDRWVFKAKKEQSPEVTYGVFPPKSFDA